MNEIATIIHHLDPVIIDIPGTPLAIRWYGLAYICGFVLGYLVLLRLSKRGLYCVKPDKLGDFITAVCIFGVLCGGRLGEFFFYWLPEVGLSGLWKDLAESVRDVRLPWLFRVWEGGMASHGGIIAVLLVAIWYARKHKLKLTEITDGLAIVCPIGLCFGRIANFINGELYGRPAPDSSLAMKFPQEFSSLSPDTQIQAISALEQTLGAPLASFCQTDSNGVATEGYLDMMMRLCRENDIFREVLGQYLTPRYPSQLFEAAAEGLILFVILIALRLGWKNAHAGIFSALFCILYAIARISTECFREPDAETWHGITRGQYLSVGIFALGIFFLVLARKNKKLQKN